METCFKICLDSKQLFYYFNNVCFSESIYKNPANRKYNWKQHFEVVMFSNKYTHLYYRKNTNKNIGGLKSEEIKTYPHLFFLYIQKHYKFRKNGFRWSQNVKIHQEFLVVVLLIVIMKLSLNHVCSENKNCCLKCCHLLWVLLLLLNFWITCNCF